MPRDFIDVRRTFAMSPKDAEYLVSLATRYRRIATSIDQDRATLTVWTTFADNEEPTSIALRFDLQVLSEDPPEMPRQEYRRRVEGKYPEEG